MTKEEKAYLEKRLDELMRKKLNLNIQMRKIDKEISALMKKMDKEIIQDE